MKFNTYILMQVAVLILIAAFWIAMICIGVHFVRKFW